MDKKDLELLRFADLSEMGIVRNWPQLARLQQLHGFPVGFMLSPATRVWKAFEIRDWVNAQEKATAEPADEAAA
jgi:hypothetical protein